MENTFANACRALEDYVESKMKILEQTVQECNAQGLGVGSKISRAEIDKATDVAEIDVLVDRLICLRQQLALLKGEVHAYPVDVNILGAVAKLSDIKESADLREMLLEEKLRENAIREELARKNVILEDNLRVLEILIKEKKTLEGQEAEIEQEQAKILEEKIATEKRKYGEMRIHLKETVEAMFPEPEIEGYMGMYGILNMLTRPLQKKERHTYIKVTPSMWPYYIELLVTHGIAEYHPTDKHQLRIVDFSDGSLGS